MAFEGPLKGLGDGLRILRKRQGLLQKEVAAALGTDISTVSAWENNANITAENLDKLLKCLKASLMDLAELLDPAPRKTGGGGQTLDGEAIRRELEATLRRLGIPGTLDGEEEEEPPKKSGRRAHQPRASLSLP